MTLKTVAEIRDPVHGYIKITGVERAVIDSPFVQRLRRIHQLAGAYMVYPGAVHTRFDHVLGAMHVAGLMAESIANNIHLDKTKIQDIRLAALLHDVGHGPFSHLFEEVLAEKTNLTHEDISQKIVLKSNVRDILENYGISSRKISDLCVGKLNKPPYMNEIVAGGLSADIMDYLLRDSYFTGVEYGKVDIHRIIDSIEIVKNHLALNQAALYAFEAILIARYEMFKAVYFHRTVRASELMLVHSMSLANNALKLTDFSKIENYLRLTDEIVFDRLMNLNANTPELRIARRLAQDHNSRRLVKCVFEKVMQRKDRTVERIFDQSRFRQELARDIARKAAVSEADVYVDVPTTPSVPYTYTREAPSSLILVQEDATGKTHKTVPINELQLVGSITGFMDILRVYTQEENRKKVAGAVHELFGSNGFMARISV
ncbi:MAG: HD domain-containing protein [Thaumarchaeota archaeon]|nr:HD domain-containing protein [Nitrososphaerota archaeon]